MVLWKSVYEVFDLVQKIGLSKIFHDFSYTKIIDSASISESTDLKRVKDGIATCALHSEKNEGYRMRTKSEAKVA